MFRAREWHHAQGGPRDRRPIRRRPLDGLRLSRDSGQDLGCRIRVGFRRRDLGPDGPCPELYVPKAWPVQGKPDGHGQRRLERGERDAERAGERYEGPVSAFDILDPSKDWTVI